MSMTFRKKWFHMKRHFKRNMSFLGRGFVAHYVAAGEPTVRVMEMSEAQAFSEPGSSIAYMAPAESTKDVYAAMGIACGMSMNGVTNVMAEGECIVYKEFKAGKANANNRKQYGNKVKAVKPGRNVPEVIRKIGVRLEENADGTPVVVIITNTPEAPSFLVRHVVSPDDIQGDMDLEEEKTALPPESSSTSGCHLFLKNPLTDEMMIEALKEAASNMLNDEHSARIKWKEENEYRDKEFGMTHLLVCLFYFITIRQLSTSSSFFFHQRTQFHDYCSKNLPEGFKICSDRYFRTCINKLQWKSCGFDEYVRSGKKPQVEWQKGQFNVEFWYSVYQAASRCYDEFFQKMMRK